MISELESESFSKEVDRAGSGIGDRRKEKLLGLKEARALLIEILYTTQAGKPSLTHELAEKINQEIGQHLGDEVKIEDLIIPSKSAGGYRNSIDRQGFERYEQVNKRVRTVYNNCLISFARMHYRTLGEIRDIEQEGIIERRHIGIARLAFAKTAFARPKPPEGQA